MDWAQSDIEEEEEEIVLEPDYNYSTCNPLGGLLKAEYPPYHRLGAKTDASAFGRLVPTDSIAVCMTPLASSRLSRELGTPIYSFNFGSRARKPRYLHPLQIEGQETHFPDLVAIAGKESGMMYYSASHLSKSPTACPVLGGCDNVRKAYSRFPLLLSPSTFHCLPAEAKVRTAEDCHAVRFWFWGRGQGYTSKEQFRCGGVQNLFQTFL